ncbi:MAG TPA: Gfo/Idh/MocA family oxidoreductase [Opitutus sp.]|nr:Gfo/Idh/MocA family oxidoreductase [Opitutus sp.]
MLPPPPRPTRREFIQLSLLAAAGVALPRLGRAAPSSTPLSRTPKVVDRPPRIALIGTSGRAQNTIRDFLQLDVEIAALCDVDATRLARGVELASPKFPDAHRYADYRELIEKEPDLDGVVVTTPDHMHAPISLLAMSRGLHVFCEKPLTRTVAEARWMRDFARQAGVVTQMGTQSSASESLRRGIELIQAGVLGQVREVHIWTDRSSRLPKEPPRHEPPPGLAWDTWLGVAAEREFNSYYHPFRWRWWQDFGCGPLGDMGCHLTNLSFRALDLAAPSEIDVVLSDPVAPGLFPASARLDYRFPARGPLAPLTLSWYEGGRTPDPALLESLGIPAQFGSKIPSNNKLIVGDRGILYGDTYIKLHGEPRFNGILKHEACTAVPVTLPRNREQGTSGHYNEWVQACRGRGTTFTGFDLAAAQTEMVLLGTVALKLGRRIRWDAATMSVPGEPSAAALLRPTYRSGFTVAARELPALPAQS